MDALVSQIKDDINDELHDIAKYIELYKTMHQRGFKRSKKIIGEIIKDEYSHAEALIELLEIEDVNTEEYDRKLIGARKQIEEL